MKRSVWIWIAVVFVASWLLDLLLHFEGGLASHALLPILLARMWVPGLAALAWSRGEGAPLGLKTPRFKLLLVSLGLPLAVIGLWFAGSIVAGGHLGLPAGVVPPDARDQTASQLAMAGDHPWIAVPAAALLLVMGSIASSVAFLGEELGWRGLLQPELEASFGVPRATVITGLVWGYWHAPLIVMGFNFPGRPVFGALALMPALCICLSFPLTWLRRDGGSVWPCAFLRGAADTMRWGAVTFVAGEGIPMSLALVWLGVAVLFAIALDRAAKPAPQPATSIRTSTGGPSGPPPSP